MFRTVLRACAAALLVAVAGCSDGTSPANGQVRVMLTDTPLDLATVHAVNVTIEELWLFPKDSVEDGGLEMERPGVATGQGMTLNLLDFQNGESVLISVLDVPAGEYNKLRMRVTAAEIVREDPNDPALEIIEAVNVPSDKVDIPVDFNVTGGETTEVTIDFDASLSVQVNETPGGYPYILRPVIVPVGVRSL